MEINSFTLARDNKKFIYKAVKEGARARKYEDALQCMDYFLHSKPSHAGITDVVDILERKTAVCVGYAEVTRALQQAVGIPAMIATSMANGLTGWGGHAWNDVYIDGHWIIL